MQSNIPASLSEMHFKLFLSKNLNKNKKSKGPILFRAYFTKKPAYESFFNGSLKVDIGLRIYKVIIQQRHIERLSIFFGGKNPRTIMIHFFFMQVDNHGNSCTMFGQHPEAL
ncbi:hypothetical protein ACJX0J_011767, partial [Zea mays]